MFVDGIPSMDGADFEHQTEAVYRLTKKASMSAGVMLSKGGEAKEKLDGAIAEPPAAADRSLSSAHACAVARLMGRESNGNMDVDGAHWISMDAASHGTRDTCDN
ncbi:hypothetical protein [Burkholderia multivorans]|uniref:hypothetical protein n=1 Tax=Burkholderia multivorans TaxID=87883 RepID=UPI00158B64C0|nr:hypothetical protein [Burkholderia multivorans]